MHGSAWVRRLASFAVLAMLCWGRTASAVDASGTWAICLGLSAGTIGCPATLSVTLSATSDVFEARGE